MFFVRDELKKVKPIFKNYILNSSLLKEFTIPYIAVSSSTLHIYRIYSIRRPGRLLNFWALRVGGFSRRALTKFLLFSASGKLIFQQSSK